MHIFVTKQLHFMQRDVFKAIADPVRREIIELLSDRPLSVNEVAENFDVSRPAISKHLKILNECGIVVVNKQGRERICQIQASNLIPAFLWLEQYRKLWDERLDSFEEYLIKLQQTKNKEDE